MKNLFFILLVIIGINTFADVTKPLGKFSERSVNYCSIGGEHFNCSLENIVYDKSRGQYIAVGSILLGEKLGYAALVMISKDGTSNWKMVKLPANNIRLNNIIESNNGGFIAVGANATILFSEDGMGWKVVHTDKGSNSILTSIATKNNHVIGLGFKLSEDKKSASTIEFISNDGGYSWQEVENPIPDFKGVIGGAIWSSKLNEYLVTGTESRLGLDAGARVVFSSKDGLSWSKNYTADSHLDGAAINIVQSNNLLAMVGVVLSLDGQVQAEIQTSEDAIHWKSASGLENVHGKLTSIIWNGSSFIAMGTDYGNEKVLIMSSSNGMDWNMIQNDIKRGPKCDFGVVWGNNKFVAVGSTYISDNITAQILNSYGGVNWLSIVD